MTELRGLLKVSDHGYYGYLISALPAKRIFWWENYFHINHEYCYACIRVRVKVVPISSEVVKATKPPKTFSPKNFIE